MERTMNEWAIYNQKKIELTKKRIRRFIEKGEDFKVLLFDIDDTINMSRKATEEQIEKINFKASEKYKRMYDDAHPFFGDQLDNKDFNKCLNYLKERVLKIFETLKKCEIEVCYSAIFVNMEEKNDNPTKRIKEKFLQDNSLDNITEIGIRLSKEQDNKYYINTSINNAREITITKKIENNGQNGNEIFLPLISLAGSKQTEYLVNSIEVNDKLSYNIDENYRTTIENLEEIISTT